MAFARPHELDIVVDDRDARQGLSAKVDRVLLSGATARVELTGIIGSNGSAEPQHFEVELTREQLADLGLVGRSVGAPDLVAAEGVPTGTPGLIGAAPAGGLRLVRLAHHGRADRLSGNAGEHSSMKR